ncbi:Zinc finger protein 511 [Colletotrichum spinosum]|uniref:Zinc finger protein 511 n=1 Tax=Colletotrichum spinosum TaxID=1347390 RepID=A0A4R8Q3Z9_9PEZI|nr:Zinc finger protein 511 [Colletotrichum spinosum]
MKRSREAEEEPSAGRHAAVDASRPRSRRGDRVAKITELDIAGASSDDVAMKCSMPPHKDALAFASYDEYEAHYIKTHTNRCIECGRNLPSAHLLSVHHEDCHDSFAAVKRERGERTYSCFVEGCERKCSTPYKRRMHLVDKHMYPKNFFFAVTKEGIDGRRSLLVEPGPRQRKPSNAHRKEPPNKGSVVSNSRTSQADGGETKKERQKDEQRTPAAVLSDPKERPDTEMDADPVPKSPDPTERPDTDMEDLAGAMSALRFIPNSVRFGRGGGRAGFAKR